MSIPSRRSPASRARGVTLTEQLPPLSTRTTTAIRIWLRSKLGRARSPCSSATARAYAQAASFAACHCLHWRRQISTTTEMPLSRWWGRRKTARPCSVSVRPTAGGGSVAVGGEPAIGQQLVDAAGRSTGAALREHVAQRGPRLDTLELTRHEDRVRDRGSLPTRVRSRKQPILLPHRDPPQRALGRVVRRRHPTVLEKRRELRPEVVADGTRTSSAPTRSTSCAFAFASGADGWTQGKLAPGEKNSAHATRAAC